MIYRKGCFMSQVFLNFESAKAIKSKTEVFFDDMKNNYRDVYIFGAGEYANKLNVFLKSKDILVKGFFVDECFADETRKLEPLSKLKERKNFCLIYGVGGGFSREFYEKTERIQKEIRECENSIFFVLPSDYYLVEQGCLNLSHEVVDEAFLRKHFEKFEQTYRMLEDDLSKKVMVEYLNAFVSYDAFALAQLGSEWNYDYDLELLFGKCDDGIVIECGAFDGKTIAEISEYTDNKYDMIALECDNDNYEKCCKRLEKYSNIKVVKLGVWDKKTKLAVVQQDSASYLKEVDDCDISDNVVDVVDIDSLVESKRVAALIMDIEGSELKALKGAQKAIADGANLAIRVYHRKEDLITIPQYIKDLNSNYKFYLRFECGASLCRAGDETTLYAICG